jgi:hypothetical protein
VVDGCAVADVAAGTVVVAVVEAGISVFVSVVPVLAFFFAGTVVAFARVTVVASAAVVRCAAAATDGVVVAGVGAVDATGTGTRTTWLTRRTTTSRRTISRLTMTFGAAARAGATRPRVPDSRTAGTAAATTAIASARPIRLGASALGSRSRKAWPIARSSGRKPISSASNAAAQSTPRARSTSPPWDVTCAGHQRRKTPADSPLAEILETRSDMT